MAQGEPKTIHTLNDYPQQPIYSNDSDPTDELEPNCQQEINEQLPEPRTSQAIREAKEQAIEQRESVERSVSEQPGHQFIRQSTV